MAAAQYGLGRVRASGDVSGAIEALRKACELFPEYGPAHYALAAAYRKAGDAARGLGVMVSDVNQDGWPDGSKETWSDAQPNRIVTLTQGAGQ